MKIGLLKENGPEKRTVLLPEHIQKLISKEHEVHVEKGAGEGCYITDDELKEAGATLSSKQDVIANSDLLLKIHFDDEELKSLPSGKAILSIFNPLVRRDAVGQLVKNKNTAFSLDIIPRTTRAQAMDVLSSQATVGGYKAVLEAASLLPRFFPMFMTAAGTIRPSKVLILGAGVAGLQAIATARKLGAVVEVFDVRAAVKEEVKSLGGKFIEVEGAKDEASAGGYAVEQTEDFKKRQQELIQDHSIKANVIITTAQIPGKTAPLLIPKSTVEKMQAGSVIIDMAASSGGNCEVTKAGETVEHKGVRVLGKTNYPAEMPVDASRMLGNNYLNFIEIITGDAHELKVDMEDNLVKGTCIAHQGEIISERLKS